MVLCNVNLLSVIPRLFNRDTTKSNNDGYGRKMKTYDFAGQFISKKLFIDTFHGGKDSYDEKMSTLGAWTRNRLIDLGPTFVKIGQLASTRSDLFCSAFASELSLLQDSCPFIEHFDARAFVESELDIDLITL